VKIKRQARAVARSVQASPAQALSARVRGLRVGYPDGRIWIPACNLLLVPQGLAAITANTVESAGHELTISCPGKLVGWRGTSVADGSAAGLSSLAVRIQFNGQVDIITDGRGPAYVTMDSLFPRNGGYAPLDVDVTPNDKVLVWLSNKQPAAGTTYTPEIVFAFLKKST